MMRLSRNRSIWILLAAAAVLVVVAIAAGAAYLLRNRRPAATEGWLDPLLEVRAESVAADLALYPLAGASELDTFDAALASGDLETAYATLAFGADISEAQRIGRLTLLGQRFAQAGQEERASLCFQQIYDVAVLSPRLSDPQRADAVLASAKGWTMLERPAEAADALDQGLALAAESPYLQMASRRELLLALETAYQEVGDQDKAQACHDRVVELDQNTRPQPPPATGNQPELLGAGQPVSSAEIGVLEEARRQAAQALILSLGTDAAPPADLVGNLAAALKAEDAAKQALFQEELEKTSQSGRRIDVQWQAIRWLLLKYRVATGGFGLSLVPEWESQSVGFRSSLSKAFENLYFDYEDLVAALPDASLMSSGSYQVRREVTLAGRLGYYPNFPVDQLVAKVQEAAQALISAGARERLYVDVAEDAQTGVRFVLTPAAEYGQAEELP